MADTEKKISELDSAAQINTDDITVLSQGNSGTGFASVKATILAIANKIVSGVNFSSALQTTDKTITGAINEVAQGGGGGASELDDLDDVSISSPSNGQVLKYNSQTEEWENANESGGGSGGHTILDNDGTALAQEDDLQFAGTYSEDDSTNGKTVVNITREMTQAAYDLLSADEKAGIIRITDDDYVCEVDDVLYGEDGQGQDVTLGDYLDSLVEGHTIKNDAGTSLTQRDNLKFVGVYTSDDSTNNKTDVQIVREFQSVADIEALTGEEAKGFQHIDDDVYDAFTASEIGFDNSDTSFTGTDVQEVLEEVDSALDSINNSLIGTEIRSGYMGDNTTKRIARNTGLLYFYRASTSLFAIVSVYATNVQTVAGTLPNTITITPHAGQTPEDSYVDISNGAGYTIGVTTIMSTWNAL